MFVRRLTPRNTFLRFARNFSETPSTESKVHEQPKPQTIAVDTPGQTEAEQKEAAEKRAQNEKKLQGVNEYKEALQFYQEGKYRISNDKFKRVLAQIEATERGSDNHIIILKRLVSNQLMLRRYQDADEYLDEIVDTVQQYSSNEPLIYAQYNNLFLHRLKTNINKAILMGKALLSDTERPNLPLIYQKQFEFNLGTAYLLKGNYVDAKVRLRECLSLKPNTQLKGFVLNNLSVASWWHKFPNFTTLPESEDEGEGSLEGAGYSEIDREYSYKQIDEDFTNVIALFKNSLFNLENVEGIKDPERKKQLEELFDQQHIVPKDYKKRNPDNNLIINPKSGTPLLNIGEFLFNTAPEKRNEATFWFKYALKFFEKNDPSNIDRCLITLALFCASSKQYVKAEGLFRKALEMLENSDSYNKVLCLQYYSQMLERLEGRQKEAEKLRTEAYALADQLPFWSNKLVHVSIPDMDL